MKLPIISLVFFLCFAAHAAADEYNTKYCQDPVELQKWDKILSNNPGSEPIAAVHALWIGLCVKVKAKQITTNQANRIFEQFRDAMVEQFQQQKPDLNGKKS